ncbi:hypothetical protein D3C87_1648770 [compost metagenome]
MLVKRITDAQLSVCFGQLIFKFLIDIFMDNEPAGRSTALSGCTYGTKYSPDDGHIQIGILRNDDGIVTAQFKDTAAKPAGHG